ncbi:uncharacterized protein LOC141590452 [Silene latifolia]|uniref:uncharacterized protein LOC141590452 n=1 Tax=Silene latifolia TaxID=37657 RepID=UPI003D77B261
MYDALLLKLQALAGKYSTRYLSYAGRIQVLNSAVFGLCNFWCMGLLLPKQVSCKIIKISRDLFWGKEDGARKHVFKSWQSMCVPWEEGGFNIKNVSNWNKAIMLKWLWCLDQNQGAIWISWVRNYLTDQSSIWHLHTKEYHPESIRGILHVREECIDKFGDILAVQRIQAQCVDKGKFSLAKAYHVLRDTFPAQAVYKAIHNGTMVPRHRVTTMMAAQHKLATVDQLVVRGMYLVNRCSLCKHEAESSEHLFFKCSYSAALLSAVKRWIGLNSSAKDLTSLLLWTNCRSKRKHWKNKWISCSLGCLVSALWTERNLRIFEGNERTAPLLLKDIVYTVTTLLLHTVNENVYMAVVEALNERSIVLSD